ncbi:hypothetical protein HRbin15_00127 [bacterium HR15]|uniref:Uncharacterized protein n=1 Tax=uncultured prokaryote TaxID=198431 RepID=H5SN90_9ZZZZ|nr:hypothetical protein HGMM_F51E10C38 [uncultured prokaryote]GBC91673.1 hypothetical protein HRbin15_00127 [bacterium HR15]
MALITVRGYYRNGQIELEELPDGIQEAEVFVTFLRFVPPLSKEERERLIQRFFERMEQGFPLGGKGYVNREELYEERIGRLVSGDGG